MKIAFYTLGCKANQFETQALERELSFGEGIRSDLVTTILDRIVVKKESTKEEIHLDIFLKLGAKFEAVFPSASINRARRFDAQGNSLWRTNGMILSANYGRTAKIHWNAVLM